MRFAIKQVVLWPRNAKFGPRTVDFEAGMVNVIAGYSKTGKSAIIPIIDYCLGSEHCAIPIATIRDACSWFGVVVEIDGGLRLFARREPGSQQSTGEMFESGGADFKLPAIIVEGNTNVGAVKRSLDRAVGLTNLPLAGLESESGFRGRPSFRDLVAFTFQPQNIVANPNVLFYKADTVEHREKLRAVFPVAVGAMDATVLAARVELDELVKTLRRREKEAQSRALVGTRLRASMKQWIDEAVELGLIVPHPNNESDDDLELLAALRSIVGKSSADVDVTVDGLEYSANEAASLQAEEGQAALALAEARSRLRRMSQLRGAADQYGAALKKQQHRLELSRWLRGAADMTERRCPICAGALGDGASALDALCDALVVIEERSRAVIIDPATFDREYAEVRREVEHSAESLRAVQSRTRELRKAVLARQELEALQSRVDRFIGRIEQAVDVIEESLEGVRDDADIDMLREQIERLKAIVSEADVEARLRAALARVAASMARIVPGLDVENPQDPVQIDPRELTVTSISEAGRRHYLWEIGSGANWLSYHVAALLGLHEEFVRQKYCPVPSFLVLDQPSQVYFPQKLAGKAVPNDDSAARLEDEDVRAVRAVYAELGRAVARSKGDLQVLVLDHAGRDVWGGLNGVRLVEEWRDGRALVPSEWLAEGDV